MENGESLEGKEKNLRWHPPSPQSSNYLTGLKLNNSLCNDTEKRVQFVPRNGQLVTWYICGPTVYDSSHVGHARTYLSFDIIRRILEDYFGYELLYVMNVTDVDDKIIKRARQNHLLTKYLERQKDSKLVQNDVLGAVEEGIKCQQMKLDEVSQAAAMATGSQQKSELTTQIAQEELKLKQLTDSLSVLHQKAEAAACLTAEEAIASFLDSGRDALSAMLDKMEGGSVTDLSIFKAHAAKYEDEFFEDMDLLGVRRPDVLTRVTEYIPAIVEYVEKIIQNGFAYATNGSVYFDTRAFISRNHFYAKLNPGAAGSTSLAAESEANFMTSEKRDKKDFALWKASKPGEPFWLSPWGEGRPGWHIECSAMASNVIGSNIDIHSGGMDLKFPHHDNELAQAEAFHSHHQWVNYFLHTGHLHIEGLKMSKSLKNFITIREALQKYTARQIRLLFILQAWDKPMNFGEAAMAEALSKEKNLRTFFQNVNVVLRTTATAGARGEEAWGPLEKELASALEKCQAGVRDRLEDNFDTSGALLALTALVTAVNVYLANVESTSRRPRALLLRKAANHVTRILSVFGLVEPGSSEIGFGSGASTAGADVSKEATLAPYLDAFLGFRDQVRGAARAGAPKEDILGMCDSVRDEVLADLGVRVEDKGTGGASVWKLDDPETLRKEREEKAEAAKAEALKKAENKRAKLVKDREKLVRDSVSALKLFASELGKKYGAVDESGIPTHGTDGKELSKGARKGVEKEFKKQNDAHEKFKLRIEVDPCLIENLNREIESVEKSIDALSGAP